MNRLARWIAVDFAPIGAEIIKAYRGDPGWHIHFGTKYSLAAGVSISAWRGLDARVRPVFTLGACVRRTPRSHVLKMFRFNHNFEVPLDLPTVKAAMRTLYARVMNVSRQELKKYDAADTEVV